MTEEIKMTCEVHGEIIAKVIKILYDKEKGILTISLVCPICSGIFHAKHDKN